MNFARTYIPTILLLAVTALALGGCGESDGASDEEQIRSVVSDLGRAFDKRDAARACELLSPRAEVHHMFFGGTFAGSGRCDDFVKQLERDDAETPTASEIEQARVAIRADLAVLTPGEDANPVGLRKFGGGWQIDNLIDPSLREPVRGEARLARGTDEQQIRATAEAAFEALARKDFKRLCNLMSPGAEAQMILTAAFAAMGDTNAEGDRDVSCAAWLRVLGSVAPEDREGALAGKIPSRADLDAARIAIRGSRATVKVAGRSPDAMIRLDGRWLIDAETQERFRLADYERCWRAAGATIPTRASELHIAAENPPRHRAVRPGRVSISGRDWHVFYTLTEDGDDPTLLSLFADLDSTVGVAYVKNPASHRDIVRKARACGNRA